MLAMCILDSGHTAILLAALCTGWNLVMITDWALCKIGCFHHRTLMLSLPKLAFVSLLILFFLTAAFVPWH
jgi:hypothetical protein